MDKIRVSLKERSYDVIVDRGVIENAGSYIRALRIGSDAFVVSNTRILGLYKKQLTQSFNRCGFTVRFATIPDSESAKSLRTATSIISQIASYDKLRSLFIVALGGGVVGDLAGFVAAIYKRGVPYVQIPTTLLAQVDSSIGGKVAVDLPVAKNLVGAFYQPRLVLSDTAALRSLPGRQLSNGLAEIIKYGVIKDSSLFRFLENNYDKLLQRDQDAIKYVVSCSSKIKASVVGLDEYDKTGLRAILNFGHTIGHAVESAANYRSYNHGEAIAIGMMVAADIAVRIGIFSSDDSERLEELITACGLPTRIEGLTADRIYGTSLHDKKFINRKNRFILPVAIGRVKVIEDIPERTILSAIRARMV